MSVAATDYAHIATDENGVPWIHGTACSFCRSADGRKRKRPGRCSRPGLVWLLGRDSNPRPIG